MSLTTIRVSEADFDPGEEIERLIESFSRSGRRGELRGRGEKPQ